MQDLDVLVEEVTGTLVVWVAGEADHTTGPVLRDALVKLIDRRPERLVVDLSGLSFLDSSGLSALVAGYQRAAATGLGFSVAGLQPKAAKLFRTTAIDTLIAVHRTVRDAVGRDHQPSDGAGGERRSRGVPLAAYFADTDTELLPQQIA